MISFKQFLHEKLVAVAKSTAYDDDFVDIFLNPTPAELSDIPAGFPSPLKNLGAWASPGAVYIWDRNQATHAHAVAETKKSSNQLGIPLYIDLHPTRKTATVRIARYSYNGSGGNPEDAIPVALRSVPALSSYNITYDI